MRERVRVEGKTALNGRELTGQTALRGVAACTVFIAHAEFFRSFRDFPWVERFYSIFYWHNVAVDLFFTLSGFILCYVYSLRSFSWWNYGVARFSRIYPLYLLTLVAYLSMSAFAFYKTGHASAEINLPTIVSSIFAVQDWPLLPHYLGINQPSWSISVEVFLYIFLFPLLWYLNDRLTVLQKTVLIIVPIVLRALVYIVFLKATSETLISGPFAPFRGILCFTSGFFVCSLGQRSDFSRRIGRNVEIAFLILVALALTVPYEPSRQAIVMAFPFLVYLSAQSNSVLTRLLSGSILIWLGDLSYSIYLWHWPVLKFLGVAMHMRDLGSMHSSVHHSGLYQASFVLTTIIAVLLIAHVSHYYFEMPLNRRLRHWLKN